MVAKKEETKPKPDRLVDPVINAFKTAYEFLKPSAKPYAKFIAKIFVLQYVAFFIAAALLVLLGVILFGSVIFAGASSTEMLKAAYQVFLNNIILLSLISLIILVIYAFIQQALHATILLGTAEMMEKKKALPIIQTSKENFTPAAKYTATYYLIILLLFGLPLLLFFIKTPAIFLIMMVLLFISAIIFVVFLFLIQFSFYELIIGKLPVMESFNKSISLVKSNIIGVFLFDIAIFAISMATGIVLQVILQILQIIFVPLFVLIPIISILVFFIIYMILLILIGILNELIILPAFYSYWKWLRGSK